MAALVTWLIRVAKKNNIKSFTTTPRESEADHGAQVHPALERLNHQQPWVVRCLSLKI
jgi:hypothetical protein